MRLTSIMIVLVLFGLTGKAFANGYGEDDSWKFEDANSKYYRLQARMSEELLKNGGPGPGNTTITQGDGSTIVFGNNQQIAGDGFQQNCDQGNYVNSSTAQVGDNFTGGIGFTADIGQSVDGTATQTNNCAQAAAQTQ